MTGFLDDVVDLAARTAGTSTLSVEVSMDGETPEGSIELTAEEVTRIVMNVDCADVASVLVPPATTIGFTYQLFSDRGSLLGELEPPIRSALVFSRLHEPQRAFYRTPEMPGPVAVLSDLDGSQLLELAVFAPELAQLEIATDDSLRGPWVRFELEQRVDGEPVCVHTQEDVQIASTTPAVCVPIGVATDKATVIEQPGDTFLVEVLRCSGTCTLTASTVGGVARTTTPSFDVQAS